MCMLNWLARHSRLRTKPLTHANYTQFINICLIADDTGVTRGAFSHDVFTVFSK